MSKTLFTLCLTFCAFSLAQTVPFAPGQSLEPGFYMVERILDGDGFTIIVDGVERSVRPIGIDAPEKRGNEPYNKEATAFLTDLLTGQAVYIAPGVDSVDDFRRALGYVSLAGRDVALLVAQAGWARVDTHSPNDTFAELYAAAVAGARAAHKGMWVDAPDSRRKWRCSSFKTQAEAQAFFEAAQTTMKRDGFGLDANKNGEACERLPKGNAVAYGH